MHGIIGDDIALEYGPDASDRDYIPGRGLKPGPVIEADPSVLIAFGFVSGAAITPSQARAASSWKRRCTNHRCMWLSLQIPRPDNDLASQIRPNRGHDGADGEPNTRRRWLRVRRSVRDQSSVSGHTKHNRVQRLSRCGATITAAAADAVGTTFIRHHRSYGDGEQKRWCGHRVLLLLLSTRRRLRPVF